MDQDGDIEMMEIPPLNDYRIVTGGNQGAEQAAETLALDYSVPVTIRIAPNHPRSTSQGEISCFCNSETLRKPGSSKFCCVSAGLFRRETSKMKMEVLFRVSAALPLT